MKSYILIGILAFIFGYSFGLLAYLVANDKAVGSIMEPPSKVIIDYTREFPYIEQGN